MGRGDEDTGVRSAGGNGTHRAPFKVYAPPAKALGGNAGTLVAARSPECSNEAAFLRAR